MKVRLKPEEGEGKLLSAVETGGDSSAQRILPFETFFFFVTGFTSLAVSASPFSIASFAACFSASSAAISISLARCAAVSAPFTRFADGCSFVEAFLFDTNL